MEEYRATTVAEAIDDDSVFIRNAERGEAVLQTDFVVATVLIIKLGDQGIVAHEGIEQGKRLTHMFAHRGRVFLSKEMTDHKDGTGVAWVTTEVLQCQLTGQQGVVGTDAAYGVEQGIDGVVVGATGIEAIW